MKLDFRKIYDSGGEEEVTRTNFYDGVRYMDFTEAVTRSSQENQGINLPLDA